MTNVVPLQPRPRRLNLLPGHATPGMPAFARNELEWGFDRAFPRSFWVRGAALPTRLRYAVQPFLVEADEFAVTAKQLTGWIEVGGHPVGMIQLDEWTPLLGATDWSFFDACDSHSQDTADFGHAVFAQWKKLYAFCT